MAGSGRDFLIAADAESSQSARCALNGRSSRRRAQRLDPLPPLASQRSGRSVRVFRSARLARPRRNNVAVVGDVVQEAVPQVGIGAVQIAVLTNGVRLDHQLGPGPPVEHLDGQGHRRTGRELHHADYQRRSPPADPLHAQTGSQTRAAEQDKRSVVAIEWPDVDARLHGTAELASALLQLARVDDFDAAPLSR